MIWLAKVLDEAAELLISKRMNSEFLVSRWVVTHLAYSIARLRAGLMRLLVLACGDHPMLDGSYAFMKAQGKVEAILKRVLPEVDGIFYSFIIDYASDQIWCFRTVMYPSCGRRIMTLMTTFRVISYVPLCQSVVQTFVSLTFGASS